MADEEKVADNKKSAVLGTILSAVKLEWFRPLVYNLGGRQLLVGGGALAVIDRIVAGAGDALGWPHAVICGAVALVAAATVFARAKEDAAEKTAKGASNASS